MLKTIYASIGNSDDRLTQKQWADYAEEFVQTITDLSEQFFGVWYSESSSEYQNMCVAFEVGEGAEKELRQQLTRLRKDYVQDSIAWSEVPQTEFL